MNTKSASLGAVATLIALAAPVATQAESSAAAVVDSCVKSFVETYMPERTVRDVKLAGEHGAIRTDREYTILLTARGAKSGTLIAEARCVAKGNGIVVVLDTSVAASDIANADFVVAMR